MSFRRWLLRHCTPAGRAGEATRGVQIMSDHEQTPLSDIPWSGLVNQAGVVGSTHGQQAIVESNRRVVP
jgi:hypothetical protein